MDAFVLIYRALALAIVAFWAWQLVSTLGKPDGWMPPRADRFPVRITPDRYRIAGVAGICAGLAVFAYSFVVFSAA